VRYVHLLILRRARASQRLSSMASLYDTASPLGADAIRTAVEQTVGTLFEELHRAPPPAPLDPRSRLDADLGFDSLARVELLDRLGCALKREIPLSRLEQLGTVADLLRLAQIIAGAAETAGLSARMVPGALEATARAPIWGEPSTATTLIETLTWHVQRHPRAPHVLLLDEDGPEDLSYAALLDGARAVASGLAERGLAPGTRVALMLPTSTDYLKAFFGVLLAGAVPVPLYPPAQRSRIEEHMRRQAEILANAGACALITFAEARSVARWLTVAGHGLGRILSVAELARPAPDHPVPYASDADTIALLQYTSGSTGAPKGVVLTHGQILANIRAMGASIGATGADVFVSWLPLYHDMGLIGAWLGSLYFGCLCVLMPPTSFLARPARWLQALHRYRGTLSASPNFGYELAARRATEADLSGLDLSSLRVTFNGAEPVIPETIERFQRRFAPHGLKPQSMTPVYGLAEAGVGLTFAPVGRAPLVDHVDRALLARSGEARAVRAGPQAAAFVSCGYALPGYRLRIVNTQGAEVPERIEGDLQFSGPSATSGYYRNPRATAGLLRGAWRNTGDRAYLAAGELYVTGRAKDIIIRRGRHFYPEQIEGAVGEVQGVRRGCVVAFGTRDAATGTERLVVVVETRETAPERCSELKSRIAERITAAIGEPADEICLAVPRSVAKTSSGKLRRAATREAYAQGLLGRTRRRTALSRLRLAYDGVALRAPRLVGEAGHVAYGLYAWCAALALGVPLLAITALVRDPLRIWRHYHRAAKLILRLLRLPLEVAFESDIDLRSSHVLVVNHSSYFDSVYLLALLEPPHRFVAKAELARAAICRGLLGRLRTLFIDRFSPERSVTEVGRIRDALSAGDRLVMFPEGTFTGHTGLRAFHLGAFQAAAAAGVPVIAVALIGTRSVLRDEQWLPRRRPVRAVFGAALTARADEKTFAAAIRLRDAARAHILRHTDEPDLAARTALVGERGAN
jgi:1-acyl-sn-glycerol-3-phosphate acyltransferase